MCKLFFSYHHKDSKKLLRKFLKYGNAEHLEYGYGLSWKTDSSWKTYKCNYFHMTDPKSKKIIQDIDSTAIASHIRNIYHENMTPQQICDEIKDVNTHPFTYKNAIFMHHGDLFLDFEGDSNSYQLQHNAIQWKDAFSKIMKYMSSEFKAEIKGNTDSEILFYLLLSIQEQLDCSEAGDMAAFLQGIVQSFYILNRILDKVGISNSSNILFSKGHYIVVAKIYKKNTLHELKNPAFYVSKDINGGMLFSNVRLKNHLQEVEKNTLYLINTETNELRTYRL